MGIGRKLIASWSRFKKFMRGAWGKRHQIIQGAGKLLEAGQKIKEQGIGGEHLGKALEYGQKIYGGAKKFVSAGEAAQQAMHSQA